MTKAQLKKWLKEHEEDTTILVCPRCRKVDISTSRHLDECDPAGEAARQENINHYD